MLLMLLQLFESLYACSYRVSASVSVKPFSFAILPTRLCLRSHVCMRSPAFLSVFLCVVVFAVVAAAATARTPAAASSLINIKRKQ